MLSEDGNPLRVQLKVWICDREIPYSSRGIEDEESITPHVSRSAINGTEQARGG
jgi:hypothetical protein